MKNDMISEMNTAYSERRQIENEMIFRRSNEKIGNQLDKLDAMHIEDDNGELVRSDGLVVHFFCECSDENCKARIPMRLSVYQEIHKNRDAFVIKPHHQVDAIEHVTVSNEDYSVVIKFYSVPDPNGTLNKTSINNA